MKIKLYKNSLQIINAEMFAYFSLLKNPNSLLKDWVEKEYKCILLTEICYDPDHLSYNQLKKFELKAKGYKVGGKVIKNREWFEVKDQSGKIINRVWDGDDVAWKGSFSAVGAAIYKKESTELIAYIDFAFRGTVVNGTLTIQWSDKGIINETFIKEILKGYNE